MTENRKASFKVGDQIKGPARMVTAERIEWYDSGMLSTAKGELARVGANIHTDEAYALDQGLPGVIVDGMSITNWCQNLLLQEFGMDYVERGELRTKFIKPAYAGESVQVLAKVLEAEKKPDGSTAYMLDLWCENDSGVKITDGHAKITVAP